VLRPLVLRADCCGGWGGFGGRELGTVPGETATGRQGGAGRSAGGGLAAAGLLASYCPAEVLAALVSSGGRGVLASVVTALGLAGKPDHASALIPLLKHDDPEVARAAEESLWRIWMRAGSRWGNEQLAYAIGLIGEQRLEEARQVLDGLVSVEPEFAEAHHQRGVVCFLLGRLGEAREAFCRALECNPLHFSAAANLGHVYAQCGQLRLALEAYRQALSLHPRLDGLGEVVLRLEELAC
jgi:tetratricopeptide (TPR) repeat protein